MSCGVDYSFGDRITLQEIQQELKLTPKRNNSPRNPLTLIKKSTTLPLPKAPTKRGEKMSRIRQTRTSFPQAQMKKVQSFEQSQCFSQTQR